MTRMVIDTIVTALVTLHSANRYPLLSRTVTRYPSRYPPLSSLSAGRYPPSHATPITSAPHTRNLPLALITSLPSHIGYVCTHWKKEGGLARREGRVGGRTRKEERERKP